MKYKLFKKFIERILEHMEISHADLFEKSRKKSVVEARQYRDKRLYVKGGSLYRTYYYTVWYSRDY